MTSSDIAITVAKVVKRSHVVVLGAGVVGLSSSLKLLDEGFDVTIVADVFPSDPKTIKYTSLWAGAHHVSLAGDDQRQDKMDQETFQTMWEMSKPGGEAEKCFMRLPQVEYYHEERANIYALNHMPEFRVLAADELPNDSKSGVAFTTVTIDTPVYLNYLLSRFLAGGGRIQRAFVQHISQAIDGAFTPLRKPDAVVVCAGLGARTLGGVEDEDVYPIRGQTVLLRAPWITFGRTLSSLDGLWTYIIPRRSGDVIVGGIKDENDWYPHARPEVTADILDRGLRLCPELSPSYSGAAGQTPGVEDLKSIIIEEGCGLRPARKGGIRLEAEILGTQMGNKALVVYNYGHGGYGYQSSWGSASIAVALLQDGLKKASLE